jgi:hypothetical protein
MLRVANRVDDRRFTSRNKPQPDKRVLLRIATHLEFIQVAEEDSRRRVNRPLTLEELRRVLRHYPGRCRTTVNGDPGPLPVSANRTRA